MVAMRTSGIKVMRNALTLVILLGGSVSFSRAEEPGAQLYKTKCAVCHGADGKGETPVGKANKLRDLASGDVQKQSDANLTEIITAGKNKMPAYGKSLQPAQVKDLLAYVRSFGKKP
jgi:cytochrome c6